MATSPVRVGVSTGSIACTGVSSASVIASLCSDSGLGDLVGAVAVGVTLKDMVAGLSGFIPW